MPHTLHFQEWLRQSAENLADMPSSKVPARPSIRESHSSIKDAGADPFKAVMCRHKQLEGKTES